MINPSIGDRIKEYRKLKGITQAELAKKTGISLSNISKYESGNRNPKTDYLTKIATALELNINELLSADHVYNDLTTNTDKYCTDIAYSADYTIERSQELIDLYFNSVANKINDKLFSEEEKRVLNEHFCEMLIRYKSLIDAMLNSKITYTNNRNNIQQYSKTLSVELTHEQLKALYFGNNADRQINDLASYIQFLPIMFSNADRKEGE